MVRYQRRRQRLTLFLVVLYSLGTVFPTGFASAQSLFFSRPGAGVSHLPLNVTAFDAPGFGEVADAINLASGNVYISMEGLARNSLLSLADEGANTVGGGGWNLSARLRLQGFAAGLTTAPSSFWLGVGDGSGQTFTKVVPDFSSTSSLPSWVRRYASKATVAYYRNQLVAGTQYSEEWLILDLQASGSVAYYFAHDGTRYEFRTNGEYPDGSQTLYQQYLGAKTGNSSVDTSSYKTMLTYTTPGSGRIAKVKDAYGRVTTYEWNETDLTLRAINYLLRNEADNTTYARRAEFSYTVPTGTAQRVVSRVTFRAPDGLGGWSTRWVDFTYLTHASGAVLVREIRRQVLGGTATIDTTYSYDSQARINRVQATGLPDTTYLYGTSADYGGLIITVSQGDKESVYEHDTSGRLRLKKVKDTNPDTGVTRWLPWTYGYPGVQDATVRINASGSAFTTNGVTWSADGYYTGGKTTINSGIADIEGTTDDDLYRSARSSFNKTFSYNVPVPASGTYQVRLHFAENYWGATGGGPGGAGKRVFSVDLEGGAARLQNYDIYADVGPMAATVKSYDVPVGDGTLNINFSASVDQPLVNAIEIIPLVEGRSATYQITDPAGRRDDYSYDAKGNFVRHSVLADSLLVREDIFSYDADNRLKTETNAKELKDYAVLSYHTFTTPDGLEYKTPKQFRNAVKVNANAVITELLYTLEDYDEQGRLTQSQRVGAGQTQTTTFAYHNGSLWQPYLPNIDGSPYQEAVKAPAVKQYGDQVATRTTLGLGSRNFQYDALGNAVWERHPGAFVSNIAVAGANATETLSERLTLRAYNGFGQPVWERLEDGTPESVAKRMWYYHPTGELKYSWEADAENVSEYRYISSTTDPNLGRLATVIWGEDTDKNGVVNTSRERSDHAYNASGQLASQTKDGFVTAYTYDTLDRVVRESRPDGGSTSTRYHLSGAVEGVNVRETKPNVYTFATTMTLDALGRITRTTYPDGSAVATTYDAFDRPVKVVDNRLTMNNAGDDRASYFVYDEVGNLIRELSPALRTLSATGVYTDSRRPYAEYSYDALGRRTAERRLLNGVVSPSLLAMPSGAEVATTSTTYDVFDRPVTVTDPKGYTTTMTYDPSGNLTSQTKQVWKGSEPDYAALNGGFDSVTTRFSYDAAGRVRQTVNPDGSWRRTTYDRFGNPVTQRDERGVTTHIYGYTYSGLLSWVAEPDMDPGTSASAAERVYRSPPSGYTRTKAYEYGARRYPAAMRTASMTTFAPSGPRTTYTYDHAGRTLLTALPDGAAVSQSYDARGNLLAIEDADGFRTEYQYDAFNHIARKHQPARKDGSGNVVATDAAAGLAAGLTASYLYDAAGNLTQEAESGLITRYHYNSLGKVVAESIPHTSGSGNLKLTTYRLDGVTTAKTTYNYEGDLGSRVASVSTTNMPAVTRGNVTVFDASLKGEATAERSTGLMTTYESFLENEHTVATTFNGLGGRIKRVFSGSSRIYASQRYTTATPTWSPDYNTYWKYDPNGNLTESWDALPDGTNPYNRFEYQYSSTNKEAQQVRDVQAKLSSDYASQTPELSGGMLLGATSGTVATTYNERDLIQKTVVSDSSAVGVAALGKQVSKTTDYSYYIDGAPYQTKVDGSPYQEFRYDPRGRVVWSLDSNGSGAGGATRTETSYGADGSTTERVVRVNDGGCLYERSTVPTLDGKDYGVGEWSAAVTSCDSSDPSSEQTYGYGSDGSLAWLVSSTTAVDSSGTAVTEIRDYAYTYDAYGNKVEVELQLTQGATVYDRALYERYLYNGNNNLKNTEVNPLENPAFPPSAYIDYHLDSRGNRVGIAGSDGPSNPYLEYEKLYDADGRVATFVRPMSTKPNPTWHYESYIVFRYDPSGDQALVADASLEVDGNDYSLSRSTISTVQVADDVQVIRAREGVYALTQGTRTDTWSPSDRLKDETFSLADGIKEEQWAIVAPFQVAKGSALSLAAPTPPISNLVGVAPLEVRAPDATVPEISPGGDAGDVAPPVEAEEAGGETAQADATVSTQGVGDTAGFDPQGLPSLGELPALEQPVAVDGAAPAQVDAPASPGFTLEAPVGALPDVLTDVGAAEVAAPEEATAVVPPSAGDLSEVTAPEGTNPPGSGSGPSDGPEAVVPPESIASPVAAPIAKALPAPIGSVTPPVGWQSEGEIETLAFYRIDEGGDYRSRRSSRDNDSSFRRATTKQETVVGRSRDSRSESRINKYERAIERGAPTTAGKSTASTRYVSTTSRYSPRSRVAVDQTAQRALTTYKPSTRTYGRNSSSRVTYTHVQLSNVQQVQESARYAPAASVCRAFPYGCAVAVGAAAAVGVLYVAGQAGERAGTYVRNRLFSEGKGNTKIHWGKQDGHMPDTQTDPERSTVTVPRDELQKVIDEHAGKGDPVNKEPPGKPGYRERIDLGDRELGTFSDRDSNVRVPTTRGIIHYGKKGVHIVPSRPRGYSVRGR